MVRVALKGEIWDAFSFSMSLTDLGFGGALTGTLLGCGAGNRFFPSWREEVGKGWRGTTETKVRRRRRITN